MYILYTCVETPHDPWSARSDRPTSTDSVKAASLAQPKGIYIYIYIYI